MKLWQMFTAPVIITLCLKQLGQWWDCKEQKRQHSLKMKDRWESNINVWLQFMYSQKWNWRGLVISKTEL